MISLENRTEIRFLQNLNSTTAFILYCVSHQRRGHRGLEAQLYGGPSKFRKNGVLLLMCRWDGESIETANSGSISSRI